MKSKKLKYNKKSRYRKNINAKKGNKRKTKYIRKNKKYTKKNKRYTRKNKKGGGEFEFKIGKLLGSGTYKDVYNIERNLLQDDSVYNNEKRRIKNNYFDLVNIYKHIFYNTILKYEYDKEIVLEDYVISIFKTIDKKKTIPIQIIDINEEIEMDLYMMNSEIRDNINNTIHNSGGPFYNIINLKDILSNKRKNRDPKTYEDTLDYLTTSFLFRTTDMEPNTYYIIDVFYINLDNSIDITEYSIFNTKKFNPNDPNDPNALEKVTDKNLNIKLDDLQLLVQSILKEKCNAENECYLLENIDDGMEQLETIFRNTSKPSMELLLLDIKIPNSCYIQLTEETYKIKLFDFDTKFTYKASKLIEFNKLKDINAELYKDIIYAINFILFLNYFKIHVLRECLTKYEGKITDVQISNINEKIREKFVEIYSIFDNNYIDTFIKENNGEIIINIINSSNNNLMKNIYKFIVIIAQLGVDKTDALKNKFTPYYMLTHYLYDGNATVSKKITENNYELKQIASSIYELIYPPES